MNSNFYFGEFRNGYSSTSLFYGGLIRNGLFYQSDLSKVDIRVCTAKNTNFHSVQMMNSALDFCVVDGETYATDSVFFNTTINTGTFYNCKFYNCSIAGGSFTKSYMTDSDFNAGTFDLGVFNNSTFNNGSFINGEFKDSTWVGGTWINGTKRTNIPPIEIVI